LDPAGEQVINLIQNVITSHNANFQPAGETEFVGCFADRGGTTGNIYTTCVGCDFDISFDTGRQYLLHQRNKVPSISGGRIARLLLLHDRHGYFGQIVEHQIIDGSAFDLANGGVRQIAPEPLTGGNANLLSHAVNVSLPIIQEDTGNVRQQPPAPDAQSIKLFAAFPVSSAFLVFRP